MTSKVEKLYEKAMQLSEDEREVLSLMLTNATRCNEAHDGWASPEIERAWREECDRRVEAMDRGDMKLIPADEVFQRIRARLSG
jgi:hypothetical protein